MQIALNRLKPHPRQDELFAKLEGDAYRDFLSDVRTRGVTQPVIVSDRTGDLVICDGHQRVRAAIDAGLESIPAEVRTFVDEPAEVQCLVMNNTQRRQLTREERDRALTYWLTFNARHSNRRIADDLGMSKNTVEKKRAELESTGQIDQFSQLEGSDGKLRPRTASRKTPRVKPPSKNYRQAQKAFEALMSLGTEDLLAAMREPDPENANHSLAGLCSGVLEHLQMVLYRYEIDAKPPEHRLAS